MGIYIPGISTLKDGCLVIYRDGAVWRARKAEKFKKVGLAVELPPHGDLVDRSKIVYTRDACGFRTMDFAHRAQLENITPVIPADPEEGGIGNV